MFSNIQALRGLAAVMVLVLHMQAMLNSNLGSHFNASFLAAGVDIFFVISGFVMVYANRSMTSNAMTFWRGRIIRIVPLYWLATFSAMALWAMGFRPNGLQAFDQGDVIGSLLFIPIHRADGQAEPIVSQGWTLTYEMFFYALFGLALALRSLRGVVIVLASLFLGLALIGLIPHTPQLLYDTFTSFLPLEFIAGCALGLWTASQRTAPSRVWSGWILLIGGLIALAMSEMYPSLPTGPNSFLRVATWGVPSAAIVTGAVVLELNKKVVTSKAILLVGAASYSLYLFHPIFAQSVVKAAGMVAARTGLAPVLIFPTFALAVAIAIGASIAVYLLIERPITNGLNARLRQGRIQSGT